MKRKFLLHQSTKTITKHKPEFYRSILEASDRGELWGLTAIALIPVALSENVSFGIPEQENIYLM